jgi:hypothetical protein
MNERDRAGGNKSCIKDKKRHSPLQVLSDCRKLLRRSSIELPVTSDRWHIRINGRKSPGRAAQRLTPVSADAIEAGACP